MKTEDLIELKNLVTDPKDIILIDECIKFWKKVEEIRQVGAEYMTETDRHELTNLILNIIRIYLMILRDHYQEDEESIQSIKNDIQGNLSGMFKLQNTNISGKVKTEFVFNPNVGPVEGVDKQKEIFAMLTPFTSFVESNIYFSFMTAYNNLIANLHPQFCELSAKASGILRKAEKEGLPEIPAAPSEVPQEKPTKKKKGK